MQTNRNWPHTPAGEALTLLMSLPAAFLKQYMGANLPETMTEELQTADYQFALQVYGGDFPAPFQDIFYLSDSIGYVFLPNQAEQRTGLFFTQAS
jgi:hypothetical protein